MYIFSRASFPFSYTSSTIPSHTFISLRSLGPKMNEPHTEQLKKRRVLMINTGGSIGSRKTDKGYQPVCGFFEKEVRSQSSLCDKAYEFSSDEFPFPPIALPLTSHNYRILYCIKEYDPVLDSSNIDMADWATIANDISQYYKQFDGFVVLHGTDTMCYTASALSYMLECLGKSVVFTGSQVPLVELRNDARDNMLGALLVAGHYVIPEVMIYFNSKLFRGNRCIKNSSVSLDAFSSPNVSPLGVMDVRIKIDWDSVRHCSDTHSFHVHTNMVKDVGILRLFPGITRATIRAFLQPPMQGVVLQSYGSGNIPDSRVDLIEDLKEATDRGVLVVNCTQCTNGHVTQAYAAGRVLKEAGVLQGADMTPEAALTKLSYLLGRIDYNMEKRKSLLLQNIRGELTVLDDTEPNFSIKDSELIRTIATALHISTSKEIHLLRRHMFPPLMCMAASKGDNDTLKDFRKQGGDFSVANYDGRTPLHVACCEGHLDTVQLLLENGASVHVRDRFDHTPLTDAIRFKRFDVIKLLLQTGAHLVESSSDIASRLCKAAAEDDVDALTAWHMAGANFSITDHENRSPIQVATEKNSKQAISFLLKCDRKLQEKSNSRSNKGVYDDMLARLTPVSLRKYQFSKKRKNSAAT